MKKTLLFTLLSLHSFAFVVEQRFDGPGCPFNTVDIVHKNKELIVDLESFELDAEKSFYRTYCFIHMVIDVPRGKKLIVENLKVKGEVELPNKTALDFNYHYFVNSSRGPMFRNHFEPSPFEKFSFESKQEFESECGKNVRFSHFMEIIYYARDNPEEMGQFRVLPKNGITYTLNWKSCREE